MHSHLQRVRNAIDTATRDIAIDELTRHPEGKWSAAAILEHLALSFSGTTKAIERCLEAGRPSALPATVRDRVATTLVVWLGHMPNGREAPTFVRPRGVPPEDALRMLRDNLAAMDAALAECERRFGSRVKVSNHPLLGPFTAGEWRRFHWVHTRHHVRQIRRLRGEAEVARQG